MNPQTASVGQRIQWVWFEVLAPTTLLVTIVYWSVLYPHEDPSPWKSTSHSAGTLHMHAGGYMVTVTCTLPLCLRSPSAVTSAASTVVMQTELWLSKLPVVFSHVSFLGLFGALYLAIALTFHGLTGK